MIKIIEPDFIHMDERGKLVQMVHSGWSQVNVITSKADAARGGHYHKVNQELFYVVNGRFRVRVRKEEKEEEYLFAEGDMFLIPEYVIHDFYYEKDTVIVSMYSRGVMLSDGQMDLYVTD